MNAKDREKTLSALVAMMRLVRGGNDATAFEIVAAAKPENIVSMASAHKLLPSIAPALELAQVKAMIDSDLIEFFQFMRKENVARNKILLKQLSSLAAGFEVQGLKPPVALKGVAFLLESQRNISDRFMIDIDFLVTPNDFEAVIDAMREMNYTPQSGISFDAQTDLHYPAFIHPNYDGSVEIHCKLSQNDTVNWLKWDALLSRSKLISLPESAIYLPDNEWRLSHLVYHSQVNGHYYNRRIISLRDCLDYFDLATRQDVDLVSVRNNFSEIHTLDEFDGLAAFAGSLFDELQPIDNITSGGKRWASQSRSVLIHNHTRKIWLLVDWAQLVTKRFFDINAWRAAFRLVSNKDHLRMRISNWWNQFKNGLGPHG